MSEVSNFYIVAGEKVYLKKIDSVKFVSQAKEANLSQLAAKLAKSTRLAVDGSTPSGILVVRGDAAKLDEIKTYPDVRSVRNAYIDPKGHELILTDEVMIGFVQALPEEQRLNICKKFNLVPLETDSNPWRVRVMDPADDAPLVIANQLSLEPGVEFAEPNALQSASYSSVPPPADNGFTNQWHLNNTGQGGGTPGADVRALDAWEFGYGSPNIRVVIHDTGVDITHPDLVNNVNPGWDFDNDDNNASNDRNAHGTACAGIVAASLNGVGVVGIAPECRIVPLRAAGSLTWSEWARTFNWAATQGDIISCSWHISPNSTLSKAIDKVVSTGRNGLGIPVFCASGNESSDSISFPASLPSTIAVGASTNFDRRANYSNFGKGLDLVAPSSGGTRRIETTDVQGTGGYNPAANGDFCQAANNTGFGGTSAATPLCAGIAALMLSANDGLTAEQIRSVMHASCSKIDAGNASYNNQGWSQEYGYGRINASVSVNASRLLQNGTVGKKIDDQDWSAGWSVGELYQSDGKTFLFLLKERGLDGEGKFNVHIHAMNENGTVGSRVVNYKWSEGWTNAQFYQAGGKTFLVLLKKQGLDGDNKFNVHLHSVNKDGTVGARVTAYKWSEGWTTAKIYQASGKTFLFLLKKAGLDGDGKFNVHLHSINDDGTVGARVAAYKWSQGWTTAQLYQSSGKTFLLLIKQNGLDGEGKFNVHLHLIHSDGTVGERVKNYKWSEGWTNAEFYAASGRNFLFLLKENGLDGEGRFNVHIHAVNHDGTVGERVANYRWTEGWSIARSYTVRQKPFLFFLKRRDGNTHLHEVREVT